MPLILVIAADSHEAAQLATLIQGRLSVDLVQAAEVGEGLLALEDRIPDLILTSPLMSPFDDGVLDEYLRDLGSAGAHVQTLRIPVLSQAPKKTKRLGFSLRRSKPEAPTTTGCDPKVFADEIEQYLARATEEKQRVESSDQPVVVERQTAGPEPAIAEEQWTAAYSQDEPEPVCEPEAETVAWRTDLLDRPPVEEETPVYQPSPVSYEEPVAYEEPIPYEEPVAHEEPVACEEPLACDEPLATYEPPAHHEEPVSPVVSSTDHYEPVEAAATWEEEVVSEPAPLEETIIEEAIVDETIVAQPAELPAVEEAIEEAPVVVAAPEPAAPAIGDDKASPTFKAALAAIRAAWGKPPRKTDALVATPEPPAPVAPRPVAARTDASAPFEVDLTRAVDVLDEGPEVDVRAEATPLTPAEPVDETDDVYELSVETIDSAPAPVAGSHADGKKKGKRATKGVKAKPARPVQAQPQVQAEPQVQAQPHVQAQPQVQAQALAPGQAAQNEWGIFDPNQCGFAALVDKLDEVADKKTERPQTSAKARVISLS